MCVCASKIEIRTAFELFDKNGDGKITADELMSCMRSIGQDTTLAETREMIKHVDIDGKN